MGHLNELLAAGIHVGPIFLPLCWAGEVEESLGSRQSELITDEGTRHVFTRRDQPRRWSVTAEATEEMTRNLSILQGGGFGRGPWQFVSPRALRTNALRAGFPGEPEYFAVFDGVPCGLVQGTSLVSGRGGIIPAHWYTASAVLDTDGRMLVDFLAGDAVISTSDVTGAGRVSLRVKAPGGAQTARVRVESSTPVRAGAPQIVLGDTPGPVRQPAGIGRVSIEVSAVSWTVIADSTDESIFKISFTAAEVGVQA